MRNKDLAEVIGRMIVVVFLVLLLNMTNWYQSLDYGCMSLECGLASLLIVLTLIWAFLPIYPYKDSSYKTRGAK